MEEENIEEKKKISLKDFIEFCKSHTLLICITIFILILTNAPNIFTNNIRVDSQLFLQEPESDYNWLGIGRFGLIVEKQLLGLSFFNPYYAGCIFLIILAIANVVLYYAIYKISKKDFGLLFLCIPMLVFTHPVFAEQFYFILQYAEIAFGILLTILACIFTFSWIQDKNWLHGFLSIFCLVFSFATYQSFVALYICLAVVGFIICYENKNTQGDKYNFLKIIAKIIASFAIAFILYKIIVNILPSYNSHIDDNYFYGKYPKREILKFILSYIKEVTLSERIFYNYGYLISGILLFIISIVKSKKIEKIQERITYILSVLVFLVTPFLMAVAIGHAPAVRVQIILPFVEGLSIMLVSDYLFKNKYLKYLGLILIIFVFEQQLFATQTLYYTDNMRNESDTQIAYEISDDISALNLGEIPSYNIAFIGYREARLNPVCQVGETIGQSLFFVSHNAYPYYYYSTNIIVRMFNVMGITYTGATVEQIESARVYAQDMPVWPSEGSIIKAEDLIIVKLSEDKLP